MPMTDLKQPTIDLDRAARERQAAMLKLEIGLRRLAREAIKAALADFDFKKALPPTNKPHPKLQAQPTNPKRRR